MTLLAILLRTSIVLWLGILVRRALASQSGAIRHGVLCAAIAGAGLVVPASLIMPARAIELPVRFGGAPETPRAPVPTPLQPLPSPAVSSSPAGVDPSPGAAIPVMGLLWAAGFAFTCAALAAGLVRLRRLARHGTPVTDARWCDAAGAIAGAYGLRRVPTLLEVNAPFGLATWGSRPARVFLPPAAREWSDDRVHAVLSHELAHVARRDWLVQTLAHAIAAVLWFNPLVWIACRLLRRDAEEACDAAVLGRGVGAADYAAHLIALARACRRQPWNSVALPMAQPSTFERRIAAMLNPRFDRTPLSRGAAVVLVLWALATTLAVASVHAVQAPPTALTGTIYDPTGAVLPGVAVTLEDVQKHSVKAVTDASGRFAFRGVGSGRYALSAELPGFRKLRAEFDLKTAADWDRAVTLQVGALQETITVSAVRMPAGTPPAGPARVRVGGNIRVPTKLLDVKPIYPDSMRAAGREGQVAIEALIGTDGTVTSVRVTSAQVHPDFAIAAVDAVRQWRFSPTLLNGQPVEVVMNVSVTFSLAD